MKFNYNNRMFIGLPQKDIVDRAFRAMFALIKKSTENKCEAAQENLVKDANLIF